MKEGERFENISLNTKCKNDTYFSEIESHNSIVEKHYRAVGPMIKSFINIYNIYNLYILIYLSMYIFIDIPKSYISIYYRDTSTHIYRYRYRYRYNIFNHWSNYNFQLLN